MPTKSTNEDRIREHFDRQIKAVKVKAAKEIVCIWMIAGFCLYAVAKWL